MVGVGFDSAPPGLVLEVPADGGLEAGREAPLGAPAERHQLGGIDAVATVVGWPIDDVMDEPLGFVQSREDPLRDGLD